MGIVTDVILPLSLAFIMFSLGLGLSINDFTRVFFKPRDFLIGLFFQIIILSIVAIIIVLFWPLTPELAIGVMILAAAPGGVTSNVLTSYAKGNIALSISLTAINSILCVITVPIILIISLSILGYGSLNGSRDLRRSIAQHLADARGLRVDAEQIVITSGAQQAFVLISFALLKAGDTVWYENPGHIAGRDVMTAMGANVMPVPIDAEGLDLDYAKNNFDIPKLIFATPSHQHPLGITMSLARRLSLLKFAGNNNSWIIEDDYDSEFRYRGRPLPALSALDEERRVFYVGTFSKALCSAVRLGYVVVPEWLIETFAKATNLLGQNASPITEAALAQFINDGRFAEHIRKMRRLYRDRRDTLIECLNENCSDLLSFTSSDAGMHIIADIESGIDDQIAYEALLGKGIESLPLSVYCLQPIERTALVLGFSGVPRKLMPKLVKKMSETLRSIH